MLSSVRDDAPPPRLSVDDITAAGRHLVRRRRRTALLSSVAGGAVAAVAAVTAALVLAAPPALTPALNPTILPSAASPQPATFADSVPFVTTYRGYEAGSYAVSDPELVTTAYQQSSIEVGIALPPVGTPSPTLAKPPTPDVPSRVQGLLSGGILVVYRAGAFDPRLFTEAKAIGLRRGSGLLRYSGEMNLSAPERSTALKLAPRIPAIAWQYAGNAWAAVYWSSLETLPERDELVAIADGLTPAPAKAFPVGFRPMFVPPGFRLLSVSYGTDLPPGNRAVSVARLVPALPRTPLSGPIELDSYPSLTLSLGRTDPQPKMVDKLDCVKNADCMRMVGDGTQYVEATLVGLRTSASLQPTQIALGMVPQDADNMADWPAAIKVLP